MVDSGSGIRVPIHLFLSSHRLLLSCIVWTFPITLLTIWLSPYIVHFVDNAGGEMNPSFHGEFNDQNRGPSMPPIGLGYHSTLEPKQWSYLLHTQALELYILPFCLEDEKGLPYWEMAVILGSVFVAVRRVTAHFQTESLWIEAQQVRAYLSFLVQYITWVKGFLVHTAFLAWCVSPQDILVLEPKLTGFLAPNSCPIGAGAFQSFLAVSLQSLWCHILFRGWMNS